MRQPLAKRKNHTGRSDATSANVGYEAQLWQMADALRGSMDAAEYKHVCLSLLFLKYIFDAFEEKHAALLAEKAQGADPEDPDEYRAQSIFWVPPEARGPDLAGGDGDRRSPRPSHSPALPGPARTTICAAGMERASARPRDLPPRGPDHLRSAELRAVDRSPARARARGTWSRRRSRRLSLSRPRAGPSPLAQHRGLGSRLALACVRWLRALALPGWSSTSGPSDSARTPVGPWRSSRGAAGASPDGDRFVERCKTMRRTTIHAPDLRAGPWRRTWLRIFAVDRTQGRPAPQPAMVKPLTPGA